jgi:hypothetical protein
MADAVADGVVKMQKREDRGQRAEDRRSATKALADRQRTEKAQARQCFSGGQATIEVTLAFICIFILLFAAIKIFIWITETMVQRQEDFEASRVDAGSIGQNEPGVYVDESNYPKLDILGESQ